MSSRGHLVTLLATSVAVAACVLAEPVGALPRNAVSRPTIVRASVVPNAGAILSSFPTVFLVPVELSDPTSTFQYAAFVDFDPTSELSLALLDTSTFEVSNLKGKTRVLEVPVPPPTSLDECHVIEIVVALELDGTSASAAHTPRQGGPGGDSVSWLYSPGGNLAGCPVLRVDGGGPLPQDSGADGSVDGALP